MIGFLDWLGQWPLERWLAILIVSAIMLVIVVWLDQRRMQAERERWVPPQATPPKPDRPAVETTRSSHADAATATPVVHRARAKTGTASQPKRSDRHVVFVLANEPIRTKLENALEAIGVESERMGNAEEVLRQARKGQPAAVFVGVEVLPQLEGKLEAPLIALVDDANVFNASKLVRTLDEHTSLSNIVSGSLLASPLAHSHLRALLKRAQEGVTAEMLGLSNGSGRVAKLTQASHREARFARMQAYFEKHGISRRTITTLLDVAEELVMNALYNAPTEAGFFDKPVSRTEDVSLPLERACEISYGVEDGVAFVRLRDTFGALRRERLMEVLNRCNSDGVELDESRGGAGLGLWRIFSAATTLSITVLPGHLTDILVRVSPRTGRAPKQLLAAHLFFEPEDDQIPELVFRGHAAIDDSITLLTG